MKWTKKEINEITAHKIMTFLFNLPDENLFVMLQIQTGKITRACSLLMKNFLKNEQSQNVVTKIICVFFYHFSLLFKSFDD